MSPPLRRLYVHGAGRSGRDAWPAAVGGEFATYRLTDAREQRSAALTSDADVVIAHSWGAIAALHAIVDGTLAPRALVLLEPALYDVARGMPAVEAHIALLATAHEHLARDDLYGFWEQIRPLFFGGPASPDMWEGERTSAAWLASVPSPWNQDVQWPAAVPTLVITGSWNAEYEEIAAALSVLGAKRETLTGFQHRPQDHPDFEETLARFTASAT